MKQSFKRQRNTLFDEITNAGYDKSSFQNNSRKNLSAKLRKKCLDDLGSGSETEHLSLQKLWMHQDDSPIFLEWLLSCCEREDSYLSFPHALLIFEADSSVLPALLKSARKAPDEDFANYAQILGTFGGEEELEILNERFNRMRENPNLFEKSDFCNELASDLEVVCRSILSNEPNNVEVAKVLVNLTEHPCPFNRERAVRTIVSFYCQFNWRVSHEISKLFTDKLNSLLKTSSSGLFVAAMPFLFVVNPKKTYQKLKSFYLKADSQKRENEIVFWLFNSNYDSVYWISRLVRELPEEVTEPLRHVLNLWLIKPLTETDLFDSIRQDLADESPSRRHSPIVQFSYLNHEKVKMLAAEAIKDEPESLLRKKLSKFVKINQK